MKTSYKKGSNLKGPDTIVHKILAYDPERMLTIKTVQVPKGFPFPKAMEKAWTVIYMEPITPEQTRVIVRMNGYSHDPESQKMKDFFREGNQVTIDSLLKKFAKKS